MSETTAVADASWRCWLCGEGASAPDYMTIRPSDIAWSVARLHTHVCAQAHALTMAENESARRREVARKAPRTTDAKR